MQVEAKRPSTGRLMPLTQRGAAQEGDHRRRLVAEGGRFMRWAPFSTRSLPIKPRVQKAPHDLQKPLSQQRIENLGLFKLWCMPAVLEPHQL